MQILKLFILIVHTLYNLFFLLGLLVIRINFMGFTEYFLLPLFKISKNRKVLAVCTPTHTVWLPILIALRHYPTISGNSWLIRIRKCRKLSRGVNDSRKSFCWREDITAILLKFNLLGRIPLRVHPTLLLLKCYLRWTLINLLAPSNLNILQLLYNTFLFLNIFLVV